MRNKFNIAPHIENAMAELGLSASELKRNYSVSEPLLGKLRRNQSVMLSSLVRVADILQIDLRDVWEVGDE